MRNELLYFGRTMPFTDRAGAEHPEAFWHMQVFEIDTNARSLTIRFTGYHSVEDFRNNSTSLANVGGTWTQTFTGQPYDLLIIQYAQAVAGVALSAWNIADKVLNTPNEGGEMESFFAEAGEIIMPEGLA